MLLLNFTHPLTETHLAAIRTLTGAAEIELRPVAVQFDVSQPFAPQLAALVDGCGVAPDEWQTLPLLINPPALNFITALLLAELHGRMGYFPAIVRLRPVAGATPPRFEVAEILNLQAVRDTARMQR